MNEAAAMELNFKFNEYQRDSDAYYASFTMEEMDQGIDPYMSFTEWLTTDRDYLARVQGRIGDYV